MKYFVTTPDDDSYLWQIELLIQSFKNIGLDHELVVGISKSSSNPYPKNLQKHQNKVEIDALAGVCANRLELLKKTMQKGILGDSFAFIHADTLIVKAIPDINNKNSILIHENKEYPQCKQWWEANKPIEWKNVGGNVILHKISFNVVACMSSLLNNENNNYLENIPHNMDYNLLHMNCVL